MNNFEFNPNCNNTAYILGYLWADGWVSLENGKYNGVSLEITTNDFNDIYPISVSLGLKQSVYHRIRENRQPQSTIRFADKNLTDFLIYNDYVSRKEKGFSKILSNFTTETTRFFIKGLFDGDGCFYISPLGTQCQITLSSCLEQDYESIINLLKELNIINNVQKVQKTNNYSALRITSKSSCLNFINFIENACNLGLKRKNDKILKMKAICIKGRKKRTFKLKTEI